MKKSMLMAMSASVLLTGCLVKKSDYEEEKAAHAATKQELLKLAEKDASAEEKFDAQTRKLREAEGELVSLRSDLMKSQAALTEARGKLEELKAAGAASIKRAAELADRQAAAERKVAEAKAMFTQRFQELKEKAEAELAVVQAKNDQLRKFMLANFSEIGRAHV